jgi:hypothetical protein
MSQKESSKMKTHDRLRRLVFYILLTGLFSQNTLASEPRITGSVKNGTNGRIAVLHTNEPHLYYKVPDRWSIEDKQVFLEKAIDGKGYSLTFVLGPSYKDSESIVISIRKKDRMAIFLDAPKKFTSAQLVIPSELGDTMTSLTPVNEFSSGSVFYYRVSLSDDQLYYLRYITKNKMQLTGILTYQFPFENEALETTSEIYLDLSLTDLKGSAEDGSMQQDMSQQSSIQTH